MQQSISKAVLITGCSTGIGRATAEHLATRGWNVYATARKPESIADLASRGCKTLALDVCDEASMRAAVATVERDEGSVGVLINNAGYGLEGAFEEVPMADIRRQFETNVFGLIAMTKLVLPGMRRQRWGRVVNLSSMGGKLTLPGGAYYHATKHAVEALSDALRFEVKGFGIDVIVIQPGPIKTRFGDTAVGSIAMPKDSPYAEFQRSTRKTNPRSLRRRPDGPLRRPARSSRRGNRKSHHRCEPKNPLQSNFSRARADGPAPMAPRPRLRRLPTHAVPPTESLTSNS